ncbi:hypothetical protein LCGC14_2526950 [marine sediment metagenome]|uniref:Uncharacterized protein n=1 Tax=marine sediment metagenome TaxID=412755 RepID=A0A0F9DN17_9ZZZZ
MCTGCEALRVRREEYTKKKLKEARNIIKTIREEIFTWDEDKFHWWYADRIEQILDPKRKEVT